LSSINNTYLRPVAQLVFLIILSALPVRCGSASHTVVKETKRASAPLIDSLFRRYLPAVRGWENVMSVRYDGTVVWNKIKLPFTYYHHKNHALITSTVYAGQSVHPVFFDKKSAYKWTGEKYDSLAANEKKVLANALKSDWYFRPFYLYSEGAAFSLPAHRTLNGHEVTVLEAAEGEYRWHFFFDTEHGFLVKIISEHPDGKSFELEFMDFRPHEGIYFPHYWLISLPDSEPPLKAVWKDIRINQPAPSP